MEGPQIEVELVPTGELRDPEPLPSHPPRFVDSERGRLVLVAAVAAVVGVVVGWTLARSSSGGESLAPSTSARASSTVSTIGDVLPEPEPTEPPATQFSPIVRTPSTTSGEVVVTSAVLPANLRGIPAEVVVTIGRQTLFILSLRTGELREQRVERQPLGPPVLHAGDGWVLLPSFDDALPSTLVRDRGAPEAIDIGDARRLIAVAGGDEFWRVDRDLLTGRAGTAELIRFDGTPLETRIDLPRFPELADPAGGLLVEEAGGTFRIDVDGGRLVTRGDLLAISADAVVTHECDDDLRCVHVLVDRATGERRELTFDERLGDDPQLARPWWVPGGALLSPDGTAVATLVRVFPDDTGFEEALVAIDLVDGSFVELAPNGDTTPLAWTPDGSALFFLTGGRLFALDRASGETVEVNPDWVGVDALAIRAVAG